MSTTHQHHYVRSRRTLLTRLRRAWDTWRHTLGGASDYDHARGHSLEHRGWISELVCLRSGLTVSMAGYRCAAHGSDRGACPVAKRDRPAREGRQAPARTRQDVTTHVWGMGD